MKDRIMLSIQFDPYYKNAEYDLILSCGGDTHTITGLRGNLNLPYIDKEFGFFSATIVTKYRVRWAKLLINDFSKSSTYDDKPDKYSHIIDTSPPIGSLFKLSVHNTVSRPMSFLRKIFK